MEQVQICESTEFGASACRNCTRNPHAVDKYQKEAGDPGDG